jgi:hypothetical protein
MLWNWLSEHTMVPDVGETREHVPLSPESEVGATKEHVPLSGESEVGKKMGPPQDRRGRGQEEEEGSTLPPLQDKRRSGNVSDGKEEEDANIQHVMNIKIG